jgi:hypothetical protein
VGCGIEEEEVDDGLTTLTSEGWGERTTRVGYALVEHRVKFPRRPRAARHVNMMPFIMSDRESLPAELHGYWPMIETCTGRLGAEDNWVGQVGYLTVHEGVVSKGQSQRRPGLHTEGFMAGAGEGAGSCRSLPIWHPWGAGRANKTGSFVGGIFMASTVDDSTAVWDVELPNELIGRQGNCEHLRETLDRSAPPTKPQPWYARGRRAGPVATHVLLQANQLFWMTDHTPHESRALPRKAYRQYFRLVTSNVAVWCGSGHAHGETRGEVCPGRRAPLLRYAAHSTPNPRGTQPAARIVTKNKFDVAGEPAPAPEPLRAASVRLEVETKAGGGCCAVQ